MPLEHIDHKSLHVELTRKYQDMKKFLQGLGPSREVSLAITKLDEMYHWAREEVTK